MKKGWLLKLVILLLVISPKIWALGDKTRLIAYISYNRTTKTGDICLINERGYNKRNLTKGQGDNTLPVWSSDGRMIAFLSNRDKGGNIYYPYIMDVNGRNQRRLASIQAIDFISWSPDGKKIAFTAQSDKDRSWEIYVINANGKNLRRLTRNKVDDRAPVWSPDGKKIAFISYKHPRSKIKIELNNKPIVTEQNLCLMNPDGTNFVALVEFKNEIFPYRHPRDVFLEYPPPQWTPDSKKIVFPFIRNYNCKECKAACSAIGIIEVKDKKMKPLTNRQYCERCASLSPDGKRIVFMAKGSEGGYGHYFIDIDGKNEKNLKDQLLKPTRGQGVRVFSWSPDKKKIAFLALIFDPIIRRVSRRRLLEYEYSAIICVVSLEKRTSFQKRYDVKELMSWERNIANIMPVWSPAK